MCVISLFGYHNVQSYNRNVYVHWVMVDRVVVFFFVVRKVEFQADIKKCCLETDATFN